MSIDKRNTHHLLITLIQSNTLNLQAINELQFICYRNDITSRIIVNNNN